MPRIHAALLTALLTAIAVLQCAPAAMAKDAPGGEPIDIVWSDLAPQPKTQEERDSMERMIAAFNEFMGGGGPPGAGAPSAAGPGVVMHGGAPGMVIDGDTLIADYDGKRVRMPGYALPLDWTEEGVRQFLLVPYVGACIHVPPPPANQIVLIETETPYKAADIFEAVTVTGVFSRFNTEIESIESGYKILAESIKPYAE